MASENAVKNAQTKRFKRLPLRHTYSPLPTHLYRPECHTHPRKRLAQGSIARLQNVCSRITWLSYRSVAVAPKNNVILSEFALCGTHMTVPKSCDMTNRKFVGKRTYVRPHRHAEIVQLAAAASKCCGQIAWRVHAFVRTSHKPHKAMRVLLDNNNNLWQDVCENADENHNIGGISKREYKIVFVWREHALLNIFSIQMIQAHFEFQARKHDSGLRKAARVFVYAVLTCLCNKKSSMYCEYSPEFFLPRLGWCAENHYDWIL